MTTPKAISPISSVVMPFGIVFQSYIAPKASKRITGTIAPWFKGRPGVPGGDDVTLRLLIEGKGLFFVFFG